MTILLRFVVNCLTKEGDVVKVVGNDPALGNWDCENGFTLTTTQETFPEWTGVAQLKTLNKSAVEYKYVIVSDLSPPQWESFAGNRVILPVDDFGERLIVNDGDFSVLPPGRGGALSCEDSAHDVKELEEVSLNPNRIIVISFRLPVQAIKEKDKWSFEWDRKNVTGNFGTIPEVQSVWWVGWPGIFGESDAERSEISDALALLCCIPVFPSQELIRQFYGVYCESTLRPLLHGVVDWTVNSTAEVFSQTAWSAYVRANNMWAHAVMEIYEDEEDILWVHDYHLMLVPMDCARKLRKGDARPSASLFSFHAPFPASELFRRLPPRKELLQGILCASVVSFHSFSFARNFLGACQYVLGLDFHCGEHGQLSLQYEGRQVYIRTNHMRPEWNILRHSSEMSEVASEGKRLRKLLALDDSKTLMVAYDELNAMCLLATKVRAFHSFISSHRKAVGRVVLVQIIAKSGSSNINQTRKQELQALVHEVQKAFPCSLYVFGFEIDNEEDMEWVPPLQAPGLHPIHAKLSLYCICDAFVNTALCDGLCLEPLKAAFLSRHHPVLIVSEFVSCGRMSRSMIGVNPVSVKDVASAFSQLISMPSEERKDRHQKLVAVTTRLSLADWAVSLLKDCKRVQLHEAGNDFIELGLGLGFRLQRMGKEFRKLDIDIAASKFHSAKTRVVFLTLEGVFTGRLDLLAMQNPDAANIRIPSWVADTLRVMCANNRTRVFLFSGRKRNIVELAVGNIPKLSLYAEHSYYYRGDDRMDWEPLLQNVDLSWQEICMETMQAYVERTDGSFIQQTDCYVQWNFSDANALQGLHQAREMQIHLKAILDGFDVDIIADKTRLEVRPHRVSKALGVEHAIKTVSLELGSVEYVLVLGEAGEHIEPELFDASEKLVEEGKVGCVQTCSVGMETSSARFYLEDFAECESLMNALCFERSRSQSEKHRKQSGGAMAGFMRRSQSMMF